jgi:flagellar biogenesis protein FliO
MEFALVKTILSLIAVLGLMVMVVVVLKKVMQSGITRRSDVVDVEILGQRVLQPKRMIYVVKVLNKVLVLSSTEQGISSVGTIDDAATIRSLELKQDDLRSVKSSTLSGFKQKLQNAESLGDFFHKPFNVILWRGDKPGIASAVGTTPDAHT